MKNNPNIDHLKLARRQIKRLGTVARNLTEMGIDWDGLDGGMETDLEALAVQVEAQIKTHLEMVEEWQPSRRRSV